MQKEIKTPPQGYISKNQINKMYSRNSKYGIKNYEKESREKEQFFLAVVISGEQQEQKANSKGNRLKIN